MRHDRIGVVVQARMGSSRLPGKIFKPLGRWPLLEHISRRCATLTVPATLVIATSQHAENDVVEAWCSQQGVACYRGSEENVLERYVLCAEAYDFAHVVRLTGDNPFPDMEELAKLIRFHVKTHLDFSHSINVLPQGAGAEVFTRDALFSSLSKASAPHHFEHADEYILENIHRFKTGSLPPVPSKNVPDLRLTIDTEADYRLCAWLVSQAGEMLTTEEAVSLCRK
jgi:spore coat polysaccharide biosynthesis protein SpsF